jgi:hypothetical protein
MRLIVALLALSLPTAAKDPVKQTGMQAAYGIGIIPEGFIRDVGQRCITPDSRSSLPLRETL